MSDYLTRTDNFMASLDVEAYRVGGSVRDELLGRQIKDADYMVRGVALDELGRILARALEHMDNPFVSKLTLRDGRQAGWRVGARGLGAIEIMLPRTEVPRAPLPGENVHRAFDIVIDPTTPLAKDAERRDFTFNAIYKRIDRLDPLWVSRDANEELQDPTQRGLYDLAHKLVTTTHPDSFRDDPLRTLRALRFVSTLGYDLSTPTLEQMKAHSAAVTGLSAKGYASGTVLDELSKLLMGDDAVKALRLARDTGVLASLLPELAPMIGFDQGSRYHDLTTDEHVFKALETAAHVDAPLRVRMALLFHDAGKPETAWVGKDGRKHYYSPSDEAWAKLTGQPEAVVAFCEDKPEDHEIVGERIWREAAVRLNVPERLREDVAHLIRHHMVTVEGKIKATKVRRARVKHGDEMLRDLYLHRMCDISGKGKANADHLQQIALLEKIRQEAAAAAVPVTAKDLEVNGHDVKELGAQGRQIGAVLSEVLDDVVCQPTDLKRTREWQIDRAAALVEGR